mgnify:CR=1 FL=1
MNFKLSEEQIGRVAHEVNREYCRAIGDPIKASWDETTEGQRNSIIKGVAYHLNSPLSTPGDAHNEWLAHKLATGWKYGEKVDEIAMTHPNMVPYDRLPPAQQAKDFIFREIVRQLGTLNTKAGTRGLLKDSETLESVEHQLNRLDEPIVGPVDLEHQEPE